MFNGPFDSPIRGYLKHVSLDATPAYTALSYVWECPHRTNTIICDDQALPVTKSLFTALKEIRRSLEGEDDEVAMTFWVDAICIDQENLAERAQQVRLMEQIYRQASVVNVWLGDRSADSDQAMQFVVELVNTLVPLQHKQLESLEFKRLRNYGLRPKTDDAWQALRRLLARPWFSRVWVIQELAMCKEVLVMCGIMILTWGTVADLLTLCTRFHLCLGSDPKNLTVWSCAEGLQLMNSIRCSMKIGGEKQDLVRLLRATSRFQSTIPQDKVFALLGLAKDSDNFLQHVNYSHGTVHTFCSIAETMIKTNVSFELLGQVRQPKRLSSLPSWVPDWSFDDSAADEPLPLHVHMQYAAAGGSTPSLRLSQTAGILDVLGRIVDGVDKLGSRLRLTASKEEALKTYSPWDEECRALVRGLQQYPTGESVAEAHWRTRICNQTSHLKVADATYGLNYESWRECLKMDMKSATGQKIDAKKLQELVPQAGAFNNAQKHSIGGRKLCVTRNGYLGMVPSESRVGDSFCIFSGFPVPFVLRKQGEHYMLIGECYVHGIMDGELTRQRGFEFREISLV
ncbi:hypothetical protein MMC11_008522 [Xylographa trunciseda]|nr:hypothetical protein [Xylographa trunciseda]